MIWKKVTDLSCMQQQPENYGGHLLDQIVPFFLVSFRNLCIVITLIAFLTISISLMEATFDHFDF